MMAGRSTQRVTCQKSSPSRTFWRHLSLPMPSEQKQNSRPPSRPVCGLGRAVLKYGRTRSMDWLKQTSSWQRKRVAFTRPRKSHPPFYGFVTDSTRVCPTPSAPKRHYQGIDEPHRLSVSQASQQARTLDFVNGDLRFLVFSTQTRTLIHPAKRHFILRFHPDA